jgi:uncharacterized protein YidB (DUF937 family)
VVSPAAHPNICSALLFLCHSFSSVVPAVQTRISPPSAINQTKLNIMALFDSILSAVTGKTDESGGAHPLVGILGGLLAQSGGLQGLADKFSQKGQAGTFSSWVGLGENEPISTDQIQQVLGSDQVRELAAKMGVDPVQAAHFLAEYLPKVVDKMTPTGKVDGSADHQQSLAALIPALMKQLGGDASRDASASP